MDYKLQWKLERRVGGLNIPHSAGVHLTPYPAIDYVNPGCDGKLYQFYVPIHTQSSAFLLNKKVQAVGVTQTDKSSEKLPEQIGLGTDEQSSDLDNKINNPVEYNELKKKKLGDSIQNNFLHPKPIETGKLLIYDKKQLKSVQNLAGGSNNDYNQSHLKRKNLKHKFCVI